MRKHRRSTTEAPQTAVAIVGVGWYTEAEWAAVKAAAADPELFEQSFKEWVVMAEEAFSRMRQPGVKLQKIPVKASELLAWCLVYSKTNNSASRAEFVSEQVRAKDELSGRADK
jgi:hypothetical protein